MTRIATRPPLNSADLKQIALAYVGRYATSEAKLAAYLRRKVQERGWEDDADAATVIASLVDLMARNHFVDDRAYADMKASGLMRRGYGPRRVRQALGAAGIAEPNVEDALQASGIEAEAAALAYARRRRLGPFAVKPVDPKSKQKAFAAMLRAGHAYTIVRQILDLEPEVVNNIDARSDC